MALKVQTCKKDYLEWSVDIPQLGKSVESPSFTLEGLVWQLKMVASRNETNEEETWAMYLVKLDEHNMLWKFVVIAYVRVKNVDVLMVHKEIIKGETELWRCTQDLFFNLYPNVEVDGYILKFVFTFDYGIERYKDVQNVEEKVTVHKSIQTSPYLDDRLCLKHLSLDFCKLMVENANVDVQLKCGDCIFRAHSPILRARSEVFRTLLQNDIVEGREGSVEIVDMDPEEFAIFIRYLYTGILPELTEDIALMLYEAGNKYNLKSLRERCGDFLAESLTLENACGILLVASSHRDEDLKDRVVSYIVKKEIPKNNAAWCKFCDDYPKLAVEVLSHAYELSD